MKPIPSTRLSEHRRARFMTWARLMLAWVGMMLFAAETPRAKRRHILQRYPLLSLDRMAGVVARLIFLRAIGMMHLQSRIGARRLRDFTGDGFRRRMRPRQLVRAAIGSRLRRALDHRDLRTRFALLADALVNIDAIAIKLARRLKHGLTRLAAIAIARSPHVRACNVCFDTGCEIADSS